MKQLNAGMLTPEEMAVARKALETALAKGAQQCRITLTKSLMDLYGTLDGELDKVSEGEAQQLTIAGTKGSFCDQERQDCQATRHDKFRIELQLPRRR